MYLLTYCSSHCLERRVLTLRSQFKQEVIGACWQDQELQDWELSTKVIY